MFEIVREERNQNKKNRLEIKELNDQILQLNKELETSKQWQSVVYAEVQKANVNSQQYAQKLSEMYSFYSTVSMQNVKNMPAYEKQSDIEKEELNKKKKKKKKKKKTNVVTGSLPVPYGDSVVSKKLNERKIFKSAKKEVNGNKMEIDIGNLNKNEVEVVCQYPQPADEVVCRYLQPADEVVCRYPQPADEVVCQYPQPADEVVCQYPQPADDSKIKEVDGHNMDTENISDATVKENNSELSIEETLRQAAESVLSESGMVYDQSSGLYYDWSSKMYYDPSTKLYYDHENGIYYYYDSDKNSYLFHSQIEVPKDTDEMTKKESDSELSDGEICSDDSEVSEVDKIDSCIRIIVVQSDTVDIGSLFVVTCKGGSIGRDPKSLICIPEDVVGRLHALLMYNEEDRTFYIKDKKTQNGTYINNERIAAPKVSSAPIEITHRDYIKIGGTTMSFHIHLGHETCTDCEPGNIQAIIALNEKNNETLLSKEDLSSQRKKEMKSLRKKYGISPGYIPKGLINSIPDRAGRRRKEIGSDAYENADVPVACASVHEEIPEDNVGHRMLAKMGWKSGEGLGKSGTGIIKPVTVDSLQKNKGLGSGTKTSLDQVGNTRKRDKWNKARERYDKIDIIK